MEANEIIEKMQNNTPVDGCDDCEVFWLALGEYYAVWHKAPHDKKAHMLVEIVLEVYLRHMNEHTSAVGVLQAV